MVSGFLFGYDTGVVSGSMLLIQPFFHLSMLWAQVIVSATVGTAALTSSVAEFVADFVGRKVIIGTAAVLFTTGAIVMGEAETILVIIVGRVIVGFAMGLSTVVVVLYVKESALATRLKWLLGWLQLMYTIGNMVSNFLTMVLHYLGDKMVWQYLLGFGAIPSILQFIAIILLPESPRWLMECDDAEGTRESLILLRGTDQIGDELEAIRLDVEEERNELDKGMRLSKPPIIRILLKPKVRQSAMNVSFLHLFQQLSGISCIILYGGSMILLSGLPTNLSLILLNIPNVLYVVATYLSNKFEPMKDDRRQLLVSSFIGKIVLIRFVHFESTVICGSEQKDSFLSRSMCFSFRTCAMCTYTEFCGFCYTNWWDGSCLPTDLNNSYKSVVGRCNHSHTANPYYKFIHSECPSDFGWFVVVGMVVFVLAYAPGLGQITQRENSQRCPVWARKTSNSIARSINWGANLIISMTFLLLMVAMTKYGTCWMFTGLCLIGVIYTAILLPDE
ncbi:hypothetical protein LOTGIDRAFT_105363 [Lottia gigantea]|uniref:Major facilitator superfamily (MFS) profile domain-containing protein n=1 Tax=Lottia gigantea TaxID=225164 RepID=V4ADC9_LOTGI|nr:hypothetical protein LOTGIDRAFT_105363 [Lottia gigantea]ESO91326.1 hypothetical protein LOTGIDRAFT_105363 [Lottia gigantea]